MSYTKNTWAVGDVITAEKLNNIENGIEIATNSGPEILELVMDANGHIPGAQVRAILQKKPLIVKYIGLESEEPES